ncbi:hypothetical protein J7T55_001495 [Diaporthe amygdali]|uniref:uncharacterized protein n=1 Tax=Phomopsis amygdali TaxID=1214568 RepID=UPI0022FE7005|nr:uncharacterized protein J7T55_001495 [Diaporthe amygdali]KAJ0115086.1 hypothetical protein J7T55_001495 [Diaporthe amygdali]
MLDQKPFELFVFGDQTYSLQTKDLRNLVHDGSNDAVVVEFLERACRTLRNDLYQLTPEYRLHAPLLSHVADLLLWKRGHCVPLDMAILCALAAAAISCSSNTLELLPLALEAVRISFQIGIIVDKMAKCIDASGRDRHSDDKADKVGELPSWTVLMAGSNVEDVVHRFAGESNLPPAARPWISARSPGDIIAVTGRPSSLARLSAWADSSVLKLRSPRPLPIFAPYHAPHLYSRSDVEELVRLTHSSLCRSSPSAGEGSRLHIPVISSTTGDIKEVTNHNNNFTTMLKSAVEQILLQPICWDPVLARLHTRVENIGGIAELRIIPFATSVDRLIYTGLHQLEPSVSLSSTAYNDIGQITLPRPRPLPKADSIAIIGMAGRFPGAADVDALWNIFYFGLDVCKEIPPLRWNLKTHVDPSGRKTNSSRVPFGCWLDDPDVFDADFFNMSAEEATRMDPAQRLALMTTYEAIEQAGVVWADALDDTDATPSTRRDRVGVYYGVSGNDWRECNAAQKIDSHFMRGSNRAFVSGRISEAFKLSGPSHTIDTSSANSLAPVHTAFLSLCGHETDMCIVGAANVMTNPDIHAGLDRGGLLSHSGNCKVFDDTSDGFCRGEGVVSLVLKRLDDALAEHDPILGVIAGAASSYDCASSRGDAHPEPSITHKNLFTTVLNNSNIEPSSIGYVEIGGCSTREEGASEIGSILDILAPIPVSGISGMSRAMPLYLGSAMANIGHGEAALGLSSIIKMLLMFRENSIPPHIGIRKRINSDFPAELARKYNTHIHTGKTIEWRKDARIESRIEPRRVLVHEVGSVARATSALLLQEPVHDPDRHEPSEMVHQPPEIDPAISYVIAISAKSKISLQCNMTNLYGWLKKETNRNQFSLAQLSYTTTARRVHYSHRTMLVASSYEDACAQIEAEMQRSRMEHKIATTDIRSLRVAHVDQTKKACPLVFAFTDSLTCNSASSLSMDYFSQLYQNFSTVRRDIHRVNQIVRLLGFPSIMDVLGLEDGDEPCQHIQSQHPCGSTNTHQTAGPFANVHTQMRRLGFPCVMDFLRLKEIDEPHQHIQAQRSVKGTKTRQIGEQLANMCTQMVLARLWRSWGMNPIAVISGGGMSIYSALNAAGVLSDVDAIYLAGTSIQLGLTQPRRTEGQLECELDWDNESAEFERIANVATYHKARISVLRLLRDDANDEMTCPDITSSNASFESVAEIGESDELLLARRLLAIFKSKYFDSKLTTVRALKEALISACRKAINLIPDHSIIQQVGPEVPILCGSMTEGIKFGTADGERISPNAMRGNLASDTPKQNMWTHLTEMVRVLYCLGARIRWDQYYLDLPPKGRRVISSLPAYSWSLKEYWIPYINDWALSKGAASKVMVAPKLESTTIHRIIEETEFVEEGGEDLRLVVEADISRDDLHGIVQGHVVDGVPLCTPSVYADIALSLGKYIQQRYRNGNLERLISVRDMAVTKALIAQPSGPQRLQACVEANWASNSAICKFSTLDRRNKPQQHAQCTICFSDTEIIEQIEQFDMASSYTKLVRALRQGITTQRTVRFTRNMMYRTLRSLAEFHPDHKLVDDIVIDSQTHEATAQVSFGQLLAQDGKHIGTFHTHPGVVDALTQPAGFALNGADGTDLDKEVYINHGWGSCYLFEPLELTKVYTVYVHMAEGQGQIWYGDIVVLDMGDGERPERVVALFERYSVQRLPRRALSIVLRAEGGGAYKNAKLQPGQDQLSQADRRREASTKLARQECPPMVPTLGSPVRGFSQAPRSSHTSSISTPGLDRDSQHLHFHVNIPLSPALPKTPLTAEALHEDSNFNARGHISHDGDYDIVRQTMQIISEESGCELADLDDDNLALADVGLDSLLSLEITSRLREELGDELSHVDLNSLFTTYPTVASLKASVIGKRPNHIARSVLSPRRRASTSTSALSSQDSVFTDVSSTTSTTTVSDTRVPQATSVILQGSPKRARATLFLFPDGSGSATSYASIPPVSSTGDLCIIAFNCPFLKKEEMMFSCHLDALIDHGYLPELRRRLSLQTNEGSTVKRTYYIGGWSAGGTLAYRAAQRLLQAEEESAACSQKNLGNMAGLVLIDAPPPIRGMDPLPDHFYKYCEQKGVFGGWSGARARKAPEWLIPHFNGTIAILRNYVAEPLTRAQCAKLKTVACIWAGESVVGADKPLEPHPDDTEGMKFLTIQRKDFSTAGWEKLLPGVDEAAVLCQRLHGAHHFSLTFRWVTLAYRVPPQL